MNKHRILTAIVLCATAICAQAATFTWTGAVDTDWNDSGNWNPSTGVPGSGDTAIIADVTNDPDLEINPTVAKLTIESGGKLTVGENMTLIIEARHGVTIESTGLLVIEREGDVQLQGGGVMQLDGAVKFIAGTGEETEPGVFQIYANSNDADAHNDNATLIVKGTGEFLGESLGRVSAGPGGSGGHHAIILETGATMRGRLTIEARLVNNGLVHSDSSTITLKCYEKTGSGTWKISGSSSKLVAEMPVTGTTCSLLDIDDGELEVKASWVSCGRMDFSKGKISVYPVATFEVGQCSTVSGAQAECGT